MSCLHFNNNELYIEKVSLKKIAKNFGSPSYIYSRAGIEKNWQAFSKAFHDIPHRICYAVKANSNIAILNLLANAGAHFDIVSLGELKRVLAAGGNPEKIIFSGVGKTLTELEAAIKHKIYCFNVESITELELLENLANQLHTTINVCIRINPHINAKTHEYISTGLKENKFGIDIAEVLNTIQQLLSFKHLRLLGIASHIGSQITSLEPFLLTFESLLEIYLQLQQKNIPIQSINIGGGLGIVYQDEQPPSIENYATAIKKKLKEFILCHASENWHDTAFPLELIIEPGRALVGNAGVLLTKIEYIKTTPHKNFAIVDAGMNDLLRPTLYTAWQNILAIEKNAAESKIYDVVGPLCESADFLGKKRELAIQTGDYLAIDTVGAYGFCMSSNYNSRPRCAEVLVDGDKTHLIRKRETIEDLIALECIPER